MSTTFPATIDTFTNPTPANNLSDASVLHSSQHANINDAVAAIETYVGVTGSTDPNSLTYKIANPSGGGGGVSRVVQSKSANFTTGVAANTDYVYFISNALTVTLASPTGNTNRYAFINTDGTTCTLTGTVNGSTNPTITRANQSIEIVSDGTNYHII